MSEHTPPAGYFSAKPPENKPVLCVLADGTHVVAAWTPLTGTPPAWVVSEADQDQQYYPPSWVDGTCWTEAEDSPNGEPSVPVVGWQYLPEDAPLHPPRPIAEAPHDGTRVLAWMHDAWRPAWHDDVSWRSDEGYEDENHPVKWWYPLPPPPPVEGGGA